MLHSCLMALRTILTYEDYAALPADGRRYEVHEGELLVTPAPSGRHQRIVLRLAFLLQPYLSRERLAEVRLGPL